MLVETAVVAAVDVVFAVDVVAVGVVVAVDVVVADVEWEELGSHCLLPLPVVDV